MLKRQNRKKNLVSACKTRRTQNQSTIWISLDVVTGIILGFLIHLWHVMLRRWMLISNMAKVSHNEVSEKLRLSTALNAWFQIALLLMLLALYDVTRTVIYNMAISDTELCEPKIPTYMLCKSFVCEELKWIVWDLDLLRGLQQITSHNISRALIQTDIHLKRF